MLADIPARRTTDTRFALDVFPDLASWERRRSELIRHLRVVTGLDPAAPAPASPARLGAARTYDGFRMRPVWLETLPGFYLAGNVFYPEAPAEQPGPAVLNPHGHARDGRLHHDEHFATLLRCATLARLGYVAFAWDMLAYGDTDQVPHRFQTVHAKLWGLTPLGVQLHNSLQVFAYVASLPEVDSTRIACTGESGGGTQTLLLTAVCEELAASAPVCMVSAHYQGGCVCEHAPGLRTDTFNVEIAALCAPRPLFLVSASGDWTAETPAVELPDLRRIYALYEAEGNLGGYHQSAPHNYNAASRQAVYAWLQRILPARSTTVHPVVEPDFSAAEIASWRTPTDLLPPERLRDDALLDALVDAQRSLSIAQPEATRRRICHLSGTWRTPAGEAGKRRPADSRPGTVLVLGDDPALAEAIRSAGRHVVLNPLNDVPVGADAGSDMLEEGFDESTTAHRIAAIVDAWDRLRLAADDMPAPTVLAASGAAGPCAALALPLLRGLKAAVIDMAGFDPDDEPEYAATLYLPGLLRIGGLRATLGACEARLYIHGAARSNLPAEQVLERPARPDEVVDWIGGGGA